jgi:cell division septation protein DedD
VAETHEPSYYEIALTNRQVIVAFVILLVCLLSAFFSGVWIGRESTARAEQQVVRNTPPSQVAQDGKNLEELQFFDSRNKPSDAKKDRREAQAPPQNSTDTTLLEDLGGSEPAPNTTVPPAGNEPAAEPGARPADQAPAAGETATAAPDTDRKGRRNQGNRTAGQTAPAPEPALPKGSVVIQVFSSADRSQADRIRDRLTGGGYQAYLSPVEVGGHTMYRVRIGPFGSRSEAQKIAEKVRKGYKLDTWVTE